MLAVSSARRYLRLTIIDVSVIVNNDTTRIGYNKEMGKKPFEQLIALSLRTHKTRSSEIIFIRLNFFHLNVRLI